MLHEFADAARYIEPPAFCAARNHADSTGAESEYHRQACTPSNAPLHQLEFIILRFLPRMSAAFY